MKTKTFDFNKEEQEKRMQEWKKSLADKIYVVEMLRDGDRERHSYVIGSFHTEKAAIKAAYEHMEMRSGKYDTLITGFRHEDHRFYQQEISYEDMLYIKSLKNKKDIKN